MIERLRLRRWRAFDRIDLDLGTGTTFIVAPNGAGKTSLLLGMAWAIFGDEAGVDARACIRASAPGAEAEVTLVLDSDRRLRIRRTITHRGRSTVEHELDGAPITERELLAILQRSFGARPAVAAQLSMMAGGGHVASERALDLKDHLYQAFGIMDLRRSADRATEMVKAAQRQRRHERSLAKLSVADRVARGAELAELQRSIGRASNERSLLVDELDHAARQRDGAAAWSRHDEAVRRRQAALTDLAAVARRLGLDEDAERLPASIDAAAAQARSDLAAATAQLAAARAEVAAASRALELLERDDPSCLTCLRPFHGSELADAVEAQHARIESASATETRWQASVDRLDELSEQLGRLGRLVAELPAEPLAPATPRPDADPDALVARTLAALQEHDKQVGRREHERDMLQRALADDDRQRQAEAVQQAAYRHEAVTTAVALALSDTADQLTQSYLEPLSEQIRWRWKALFGEGGLQLKPDGTIVRAVGDRELPWHTLSGGERIWARLVTHLLVLATSTNLPFAWFDEPLEHLDPRARRAVAAALSTATRTGGPHQLVVTTYEHAIARQLAADVPEASIRYLHPSPTRS